MKRQVLVLSEKSKKLLQEVKGKETCKCNKKGIPIKFFADVTSKYDTIIRDLNPKKWQPSVIKEVPEDLMSTLMSVISFYSYGELQPAGTELYLTIKH